MPQPETRPTDADRARTFLDVWSKSGTERHREQAKKYLAAEFAAFRAEVVEEAAKVADAQIEKAAIGINANFGTPAEKFYQLEAAVSRTIAAAIRVLRCPPGS